MSITSREQEVRGKYVATKQDLQEYLPQTLAQKAIEQGGVAKGTGRRSIPNAFKRIFINRKEA